MDLSLIFKDEEEAKEDLYATWMQDRSAQIGLSFYIYRHLLETLPEKG